MNDATKIRAIIFRDGEHWVGQCLEYDIGAQASDPKILQERLKMAIRLELQTSIEVTGEPFGGIPRAPQVFHDVWNERPDFATSRVTDVGDGPHGVSLDIAPVAA